jgi:type IV pilus assembly protein PilC
VLARGNGCEMGMKPSSKDLAVFYYQLGTMLQAGVSIRNALTSLQKTGPRPLRKTVAFLGERVQEGEPLHQAVAESPRCRFARLDQHTLAVSEQSGALDVGLLSLANYYENLARARRKMISASMFPALILMVAVFVSHLPALVAGALGQGNYGLPEYLRDTVGFLILLVLALGAMGWLVRTALKTPKLDLVTDRFIRFLPLVGRVRFDYALSQWISSVRLMLKAGFGVVPALEYSSKTINSPQIAHAYDIARPLIDSQLEVSRALQASGVFPEQLIQFWETGEQSGRLDDMLDRLAQYYEERWRQSLDLLSSWLPRIAYGLVCVYMIFQMANLLGPLIGAYTEALQ